MQVVETRRSAAAAQGARVLEGARLTGGASRQRASAFFLRDLRIDLAYPASFALHALHVLLGTAAYFFLARFVDRGAGGGPAAFPFLLVGLALNAYMTSWLVCFTHAIRSGQISGTLKLVLASPISIGEFLGYSALYPSVRAGADAILYVAGGILLGLSFADASGPATVAVLALSSLAFAAIGIASAGVTLVWKRGEPLLAVFMSLSWLLGGVMYPVDLLPTPLQQVSGLLPITHATTALRLAVLHGGRDLARELGPLAGFALIGLPLAVTGFRLALNRARRSGTIGHW